MIILYVALTVHLGLSTWYCWSINKQCNELDAHLKKLGSFR